MDDLFNENDPLNVDTLREELTKKWQEKFPSADPELLKAKVESDIYIKTMERQKDELRNDLIARDKEIQARANMEELIDRINKGQNTPVVTPPVKPEEKPNLGLQDIEKLFDSRFEQKQIADKENKNFSEVQKKLQERYGHNAQSVLQEQAMNLGLSKDDINSLAKRSPEAFFRMMGLDQQRQDLFNAPPRSGFRSDNFLPAPVKRTLTYYEKLRTTNPKEYWDPKTQVQMHKDGETLGAAFFDDGQPITGNTF